ncbi:unnamed protein product, partial [Brassica rapa subsp. narinosa]
SVYLFACFCLTVVTTSLPHHSGTVSTFFLLAAVTSPSFDRGRTR